MALVAFAILDACHVDENFPTHAALYAEIYHGRWIEIGDGKQLVDVLGGEYLDAFRVP